MSGARLMYTQIMRWSSGTHPDFCRRMAATLHYGAHQRDGTSYLTSLYCMYFLYLHTGIWQHCADTLLSLLSVRATAHVTHNLTGPLRCRTVNSVAFEPRPPNAKSLYLFQPWITWTDSKAGGLVPIWLDDTWGNCANKKVWCGTHCVLIAREVVN